MTLVRIWRHEPTRRHENGVLAGSGYRWDEWRLRRHLLLTGISFALIGAAPVAIAQDDGDIGLSLLAIGVFLGAIVICRLLWPRVVVFLRDGRVLTPHGITWQFWVRALDFPHGEVASIEVTADCREWGVMLFTIEGRSVLICQNMQKADAHLVAVQLSKALREMRESLATITSRHHPAPAHAARMLLR